MGITYEDHIARFSDIATVEEAEGLLEWLERHPQAEVDLAHCVHMHTANLQVLMAVRPKIAVWPEDTDFSLWLKQPLAPPEHR